MASKLNTDRLSQAIKVKRGSKGLRETAKEIGDISASTLSRIELGNLPDIDTYIKLCSWLDVSTEFFVIHEDTEHEESSQDVIVAHLRADKNLQPNTAKALIEMISLAYKTID